MSGLVRYPINLGLWKDDTTGVRMRMGYFDLPSDLTARDVERIIAMVRTLAIEQPVTTDAVGQRTENPT